MPTIYKPKRKKPSNDFSRAERMKVYNTQRWRDLRALKLARSPLCEVCLNADRTKAAEHVDHIDSFTKYTGDARTCKAYDYGNLQSICAECHARKTIKEHRGAR